MADHEVTLGELSRGQERLEREQSKLISRPEYEADQEGIDRRFQESANVHAEMKAAAAADRAKFGAETKDTNARLDAYDKTQRENRSKWTLAMVSSGAAFVLSVIAGLILAAVR